MIIESKPAQHVWNFNVIQSRESTDLQRSSQILTDLHPVMRLAPSSHHIEVWKIQSIGKYSVMEKLTDHVENRLRVLVTTVFHKQMPEAFRLVRCTNGILQSSL